MPQSTFTKVMTILLVASTLMLVCPSGGVASIVMNGSFEQGVDPLAEAPVGIPFASLYEGSTDIPGWVVTHGGIDYGNSWGASHGARSIDLNCLEPGGISQTFATIPGFEYWVTFDMGGNWEGPPVIKQMRVSAADSSADFSFDTTGKHRHDMGWLTKSWEFVATHNSTTLQFSSLVFTGNEQWGAAYGPALDNVNVSSAGNIVPEPTTFLTWSILGMIGVMTCLLRRRRWKWGVIQFWRLTGQEREPTC